MVSTKKTEVLYQPAPGKLYVEPKLTGNGQRLNKVNRFIFLCSAPHSHRMSSSITKCASVLLEPAPSFAYYTQKFKQEKHHHPDQAE
ncbi:hypothetical protein DPMN_120184 [Dreissena polymorpha]|uniref:Uncharacterized protein n=1 Tax=Dreissena polymorpha TaxID=45954 RepID=A0A9D4JRU9_DREPO|nr:hypothetical protein DPMN_120184 [Dreissena polymorpha]